jgi:hypothetical protein
MEINLRTEEKYKKKKASLDRTRIDKSNLESILGKML